jgi:hypothetical protein
MASGMNRAYLTPRTKIVKVPRFNIGVNSSLKTDFRVDMTKVFVQEDCKLKCYSFAAVSGLPSKVTK